MLIDDYTVGMGFVYIPGVVVVVVMDVSLVAVLVYFGFTPLCQIYPGLVGLA